jgi:hypothetical protein
LKRGGDQVKGDGVLAIAAKLLKITVTIFTRKEK